MLIFHQNEDNRSSEIRDHEKQTIAGGCLAVDTADPSVLVIITTTIILPNNHEQIDQLLSIIAYTLGSHNHSRVFIWLPMFDSHFNMSQQQVKSKDDCLMVVDILDLKNNDAIEWDHERYEMITKRETIEAYAKPLTVLMRDNAFWAKEWTEKGAKDRIYSASGIFLIVDRINGEPCAFGRIFTITANESQGEKLAYLSDIVVCSQHQRKGLGAIVVSTLVNMFVDGYTGHELLGRLCLWCANQGVGALAAPKLYRRFGFEFSWSPQHNRLALIHIDEFYQRNK
jgi:ribosomal protein S18 acetylase RimI-like enzyme